MKKLILSLLLVLLSPALVQAQDVNDFYFESFDGTYEISRDAENFSTLDVSEQLVAVFPDFDQNRGIERAIPQTYKDYDLNLVIQSVTNEAGDERPFTTYESNGNLVVRIGDASVYVQGRQTYVIDYTMRNVISFYDDHDEFFWDINGDQWLQEFQSVSARVIVPESISASLQDRSKCFVGAFGSTSENCDILASDGEGAQSFTFSTRESLAANETLSIVLGFESGTFKEDTTARNQRLMVLGVSAAIVLVAFGFMYRRWSLVGKDPDKGVVVPQYEPPQHMSSVMSAAVLADGFNPATISAGIIELAVKGYIVIHHHKEKKLLKDKDVYELELVKSIEDVKQAELRDIAKALFGGNKTGEKVDLSKKKNKLYKKSESLKKTIAQDLVNQGYYTKNPTKVQSKYYGYAALLAFVSFAAFGFGDAIAPNGWLLGLALLVSAAITGFFGRFMPARSVKGAQMQNYILGVKDYLSLAETERIKYLESPEGSQRWGKPTEKGTLIKLYEEFLPFAMIFDMEGDWSKQMQHLYAEPPQWFNSRSAFHAAMLHNSVSTISTQSASSFSAPSSSGSGFSGGGAGGGGGGGGGGGW